MDRLQRMGALACATVALAAGPSGCGNSGGSGSTVTVAGDVPLAYVMRSTSVSLAPTNGAPSAPLRHAICCGIPLPHASFLRPIAGTRSRFR